MEFNTYEYVHPELKYIPMTNEYAANYWHRQGWMACRLAFILHDPEDKGPQYEY